MMNWQETLTVFQRLHELQAEERSAVLATVIAIRGSAYRRPGAKLLIEDDGTLLGNVSGGCLEQDVRERSLALLGCDMGEVVHYETSGDEDALWGMGLGCDGEVDILLQPTRKWPVALIDEVLEQLQGSNVLIITQSLPPESSMLAIQPTDEGMDPGLTEKAFMERLDPPPTLLVFGGGDDALSMVQQAYGLGMRVCVVDHRPAYVGEGRFPPGVTRFERRPEAGLDGLPAGRDVYAVLKTHAFTVDQKWLYQLLESEVAYIGLLGPRKRRDELLANVERPDLSCVYGPAGRDLGGEGPPLVGASILAEILALFHGRNALPLRDRGKGIHEG